MGEMPQGESDELTERQQAVMDAVLALMVEGDPLTMTAVARKASCSKETLYKWFGDRDGLLTATVRWRISCRALHTSPIPPFPIRRSRT